MVEMAKEKKSLYLLGAKPGVAEQAAEKLKEKHPGLIITGTHDGYFQDNEKIAADIRASMADVVFVCLGAPKQELWMKKNMARQQEHICCWGLADLWMYLRALFSVRRKYSRKPAWNGFIVC